MMLAEAKDTDPSEAQSATVAASCIQQVDLDHLSLQQALRDFDCANARVLELSHRLVQSEQRWRDLVDETERLRLRLAVFERRPKGLLRPIARRLVGKLRQLGVQIRDNLS